MVTELSVFYGVEIGLPLIALYLNNICSQYFVIFCVFARCVYAKLTYINLPSKSLLKWENTALAYLTGTSTLVCNIYFSNGDFPLIDYH